MLTLALALMLNQSGCQPGGNCQAASFLPTCKAVSTFPPCGDSQRGVIRCALSDFDGGGSPCQAFCNGTSWACVGSGGSTTVFDAGTVITATTADVNLFVDPTGSDSNDCTSSGASACLTFQGALNKSPKVLRHRLTVTAAAGSYAGFVIAGFVVDPSFQKSTAGILIDGALANITPTTGTATGTATAGTAGSGTTFGTLTDSTQTWTTNDLRGRLVVITAGTGVGQTKVITANTATALTIAGTWTAPVAASTVYALQAPSVNITSTTAVVPTPIGASSVVAAGIQIVNVGQSSGAGTSSGQITIRNVAVSVAGSTALISSGVHGVNLLQVSLTGTGMLLQNGSRMTMTAGTIVSSSIAVNMVLGSQALILQSFVNSSSVGMLGNSAGTQLNSTSNQVLVAGTNSDCVAVGFGGVGTATSTRCDCQSAASSGGVVAGNAMSIVTGQPISSITVATGFDVTNCTYGAAAQNGNVMFNQTATFSGNALTYSAMGINGGSVILPSAITVTSGTADLAVDNGAATSTYGALSAAFSCLTSLQTTSRVCRL